MQLFQESEEQLAREEIELISTVSRAEIAVYMKQCRKTHLQMLHHMEGIHQRELENVQRIHQEELCKVNTIHSEELTSIKSNFRKEEEKLKETFNSELQAHLENFTKKLSELRAYVMTLEQKLTSKNTNTIRRK